MLLKVKVQWLFVMFLCVLWLSLWLKVRFMPILINVHSMYIFVCVCVCWHSVRTYVQKMRWMLLKWNEMMKHPPVLIMNETTSLRHACMQAHAHIHTHTHTYMHILTHTCMYACMYAFAEMAPKLSVLVWYWTYEYGMNLGLVKSPSYWSSFVILVNTAFNAGNLILDQLPSLIVPFTAFYMITSRK